MECKQESLFLEVGLGGHTHKEWNGLSTPLTDCHENAYGGEWQ